MKRRRERACHALKGRSTSALGASDTMWGFFKSFSSVPPGRLFHMAICIVIYNSIAITKLGIDAMGAVLGRYWACPRRHMMLIYSRPDSQSPVCVSLLYTSPKTDRD